MRPSSLHTEHEDLRVKPLSFHQSITASTYDSAESIATPLSESDSDDEQLRARWLHHCTHRSEKQVQNNHSERESLMSSSSQDPINTGKLVALQNRLTQETFSDRVDFPLRHQRFFGSSESFFRFSNPANVAKSLLDGNSDHLLAEARSELMKQEYKVESLNTCIDELQQQTYASAVGIGGCPFRRCRISKRASSTTGRIGPERESTSRYSDWKYSRNGE